MLGKGDASWQQRLLSVVSISALDFSSDWSRAQISSSGTGTRTAGSSGKCSSMFLPQGRCFCSISAAAFTLVQEDMDEPWNQGRQNGLLLMAHLAAMGGLQMTPAQESLLFSALSGGPHHSGASTRVCGIPAIAGCSASESLSVPEA